MQLASPDCPTLRTSLPRRLTGIDALRGSAALLVLLFHGLGYFASTLYDTHRLGYILTYPIRSGFIGVHLFLILSGFCIHMRLAKSNRQTPSLSFKAFWAKRFWRLYPAYLAILVLSAFFMIVSRAWLANDLSFTNMYQQWHHLQNNLLSHLVMAHLFFPAYAMSINGVLWSLALEEHLYLLYVPVLWIRNRLGIRGLLIVSGGISLLWRLVCIQVWGAGPVMPVGMSQYAPFLLMQAPSRWFEWCLGVAAVEAYVGRITLPRWCDSGKVSLAAAGLAIACSYTSTGWIFREPLWGLSFFILVNRVVKYEKSPQTRTPGKLVRMAAGLGVISYSLYLVHPILVHLAKLLAFNFGANQSLFFVMRLGAVMLSIPVAYVFYRLFEKPFITRKSNIKTRFSHSPSPPLRDPANPDTPDTPDTTAATARPPAGNKAA